MKAVLWTGEHGGTLKQICQSGSCQKSFFAIIITFEKMILARPRSCLQLRICGASYQNLTNENSRRLLTRIEDVPFLVMSFWGNENSLFLVFMYWRDCLQWRRHAGYFKFKCTRNRTLDCEHNKTCTSSSLYWLEVLVYYSFKTNLWFITPELVSFSTDINKTSGQYHRTSLTVSSFRRFLMQIFFLSPKKWNGRQKKNLRYTENLLFWVL